MLAAIVLSAACGGMRSSGNLEKSRARLELAKDFLRKGELEAAEAEANNALALHKGNEETHYVLGLIDLMRSLASHRISEIDGCLTGIDADVQRAEKEKHLLAADAHFARASALAPDFGEAWANRGVVATLLERLDQSVEHLTRALEYPARLENPVVVRANLGWAFFLRHDLVAATRELLQTTQSQPRMCIATYRLGRVYFARKEWEKALQKFQDVVGQPDCPIQDAHLYLMKTLVELGMTEGLPEAGRACVALAPNSCIAAQCRDLDTVPGVDMPGADAVESGERRLEATPNAVP